MAVALQLASTVIVSRLLTPSEVGVFAIAAVFAALASSFRDFGVAEYLIQARDLSTERIRAAFGVNIAISWSMAGLLLLMSPLAAAFYAEPAVGQVMRVQALSFVFVPFGAITMAWFRRELNYLPIVASNLFSNVVGFTTTVTLAALGFGTMSLAWGGLAGIVAVVAATTWFRPSELPRWPSWRGAGEVLHFGSFTSGSYVMHTLGRGAPELIVGRAAGATDVGIFSRASGLVEIFNRLTLNPLLQVCMPYFSQQNRQHGALSSAYTLSVSLITALGWPFLGCMAVLAYSAIHIVYGAQWLEAVALAQVVCIAGALEMLFFLAREALLADGQARPAMRLQMHLLAARVVGLLMVVPFGLLGAAWGLVTAAVAGFAIATWHLRTVGVRAADVLRSCLPSLALTGVTAGPLAAVTSFKPIDHGNFVLWALAGAAWAIPAWLLGLRMLRHRLWDEGARVVAGLLGRKDAPN